MLSRESFLLASGAALGAAAVVLWRTALRKHASKLRGGTYHAGMIRANPEHVLQYMALHDQTWPEVMACMHKCNMRDFVVWYHEETSTMFHQFIYVGDDFDADMANVAASPVVRFWWTFCEPCQEPLHWKGPPPSQGGDGHPAYPGQWWSPLRQVNHCGAWSVDWSDELGPNPSFVPCHPQRMHTTKDSPPAVHNRTGAAAGWTSWRQEPFVALK